MTAEGTFFGFIIVFFGLICLGGVYEFLSHLPSFIRKTRADWDKAKAWRREVMRALKEDMDVHE